MAYTLTEHTFKQRERSETNTIDCNQCYNKLYSQQNDAAYGVKETSQSKGQQNEPLKKQSGLIQVVIKLRSNADRCAKAWT